MNLFNISPNRAQLLGGFLLIGLVGPTLGRAQQPMLVPQPRELQAERGNFRIAPNLKIVLLPSPVTEDQSAVENLAEELKAIARMDVAVVSTVPGASTPAIVLGRLEQPAMRSLLSASGINSSGIGDQGYALDVTPSRVLLAGKDAAGMFYGVQTLKQLLIGEAEGAEILGVRIRDWPAVIYRGTQVDMARGPVPKLEYLKHIVRTISEYKLNQLYLYMEDSFQLKGQPLVGVLSDTLKPEDWTELIAYANRYYVDIVPAQNSCGHLHKVLRFEEYAHLGETPHGDVLAPQPATYDYVQSVFEQMIPVFPSSFYNVGCDETWELGRGKSAARAQEIGLGQLYIENLLRVHDMVRKYNKQVIFWGDIALEHPELLKTLPKDLIVATWEYFPHPTYDAWLKPFTDAGIKIIVCPWVGSGSLIMPDYELAAYNIGHFVDEAKKAGAIGMDNTIWNDDGETFYGLNWWSIVYGSAAGWEPGIPDVATFDQKYDWAFYRNTDHRFADAAKQLSHINEILRQRDLGKVYDADYGGTGDDLFWHDPFTPQGREDAGKALPVAAQIRHLAEGAYTVFVNSAQRARRNADTLPYLEWSALKLDALGMRYIYLQEMDAAYANSLAHAGDKDPLVASMGLWQIESTNGRLEDLREYSTKLRELYKQLWLQENYSTWLPNMLQLYDRQSQTWQDKIARFKQIESDFERKKALPPAESLGLMPAPAAK